MCIDGARLSDMDTDGPTPFDGGLLYGECRAGEGIQRLWVILVLGPHT